VDVIVLVAHPHPSRAVLNLCMPYSSRDEIATAVEETIHVALLEERTE